MQVKLSPNEQIPIFRIRVSEPIKLSESLKSISVQVLNKLTLLNFLSMRIISIEYY